MQQALVADLESLILNPWQPPFRQRPHQVRLNDAQTFRRPALQQPKEQCRAVVGRFHGHVADVEQSRQKG